LPPISKLFDRHCPVRYLMNPRVGTRCGGRLRQQLVSAEQISYRVIA
jgi:hypothetical protein